MSSNTKTERFELRLRPNIPAEIGLLNELEQRDGVYGAKTELLRECLRRGFTALGAAVDSHPEGASEEVILASLASSFHSGEYSYRIGKLFLDAREDIVKEAEPGNTQPASTTEVEGNAERLTPPTQTQSQPTAEPTLKDESASEVADSPVKSQTNWNRFRRVAGSGDDETGQE